ncbi:MAG: adenylate kinase [Chlamydiota bacterium]
MVVILLGPPGAGKGTHAGPLSAKLKVPHISTGDLFRENIRNQTPLGKVARNYMDKGNLVPDEIVLNMLFERTCGADCQNGYILDGVPRTLAQARTLELHLKDHLLVALNFQISDAALIERIGGRIACKTCGRPYHKKYDPPRIETLCDHCGGEIYQRDDDREEIVRKRLEVYRAQTEPLIAYYAQTGSFLCQIDSHRSKAEVFQDVLNVLPVMA